MAEKGAVKKHSQQKDLWNRARRSAALIYRWIKIWSKCKQAFLGMEKSNWKIQVPFRYGLFYSSHEKISWDLWLLSKISCSGCPYAEKYKKAKGNRTVRVNQELTVMYQEVIRNLESIQGALFRTNRFIQAEGTFEIMKNDRWYKRMKVKTTA